VEQSLVPYLSTSRGAPSIAVTTNRGDNNLVFDVSKGDAVAANYPVQVGLITGETSSHASTFTIRATRSTVTASRGHVDDPTSSFMCCGLLKALGLKFTITYLVFTFAMGGMNCFQRVFVVITTTEASVSHY
jgi:hypothetical protein